MTWEDGLSRTFHFEWLFRNRPEVLLACGQNSASPLAAPPSSSSAHQATVCNDGRSVSIRWDEQVQSTFDAQWLLRFAQPDVVQGQPDKSLEPISLRSRSGPNAIPSIPFADLSSDGGVLSLLETLNRDGVCIVRGVPTVRGAVLDLARRIGPVMRTIYGEMFDVEAVPDPINIAYSPLGLHLHQDLVYYEAPPGLQLLHCLSFDPGVAGGESTFADAFHAAALLRAQDPGAFDTLARVPATFQKVHYARASPVHLVYRRPHVALNHRREVTGVFWAPAFEGPLQATEADAAEYLAAYRRFAAIAESGAVRLEVRLGPGDAAVFNNRRMLHGRNAFSAAAPGARRHLQGCYVQMEDFLSRLQVLRHLAAAGPAGEGPAAGGVWAPAPARVGNQDYS